MCFDDGPRLGVAGHLQIGKDSMMRTPVDAFDDGVGRAPQFVMQSSVDQPSQDRLGGLVAVKRETGDVGVRRTPPDASF